MANKKQPTQNEILLSIIKDIPLFHSGEDVYATISVGSHHENWPVRSRGFKRWLSQMFYLIAEKSPSSEALNSTLITIEGKGQFSGPETKVFVRLAYHDNRLYLDLGNEDWKAVEVTPVGWQIIDDPPVKFVRPGGMLPLPTPSKNGDIGELHKFLNIKDESQFILIASWLVGAIHPSGPYTILVINGEQGSGKSTAARALRNIIDPNKSPIRSLPRNERDLSISARNGWIMAYDNISGIPNMLSDAFCRLTTGGGLTTRKLYTDIDETIFDAKRPLILNGITDMINRHDLADRCIYITFPPIPREKRGMEKNIKKAFQESLPIILGGVLDAASMALRRQDKIEMREVGLSRMADFHAWVIAAEPALPWSDGSFSDAYKNNRTNIVEMSVQGSVVGNILTTWFEDMVFWEGTPTELLAELEEVAEEKIKKLKEWPPDATRLGRRITQISSFMRRCGIDIQVDRSKKKRLYRITKQNSVTSVTSVTDQKDQGVMGDAKHKDDANSVTDPKTDNLASPNKTEEKQKDKPKSDAGDANDGKYTLLSKRGYRCGDCRAFDKKTDTCHGQAFFNGKSGRGTHIDNVAECLRE